MHLNFKELGSENSQQLIILHGLFGSLDNWISLGKRFSEDYHVFLVDQRNHGKSPHDDDFSYDDMANDLYDFIVEHGIQDPIILGHSMGGKTAMNFAVQKPDMLEKLIVVDIAPKTYPVHHNEIIEALKSIPLETIQKRNEAEDWLASHIRQVDTRQFLLKNLSRDPEGGFRWKMNLPIIEKNIQIIGQGLASDDLFEKPTLFIRGLRSDYIQDEDIPLLTEHFPIANLASIENAGHWVHVEAPDDLYDLVVNFIEQ